MERIEDCIRVADKVNRPDVGVMFNLCHWLRVEDEKSLRPVLEAARPYLMAVSINGADRAEDVRSGKGQMILPLGKGAFDVGQVLRILEEIGYRGPVGLQCWGLPGDARMHLAESIEAWKRMAKSAGTPK
jgi:sugar phosphate isomerase/epimerase